MRSMKTEDLFENSEFSKGASVRYVESVKEIILTNEGTGEEIKIICSECENDKFDKGESIRCTCCDKEIEGTY